MAWLGSRPKGRLAQWKNKASCYAFTVRRNARTARLSRHFFRTSSNLIIVIFGYSDVIWPKESSSEVWQVPPETLYISRCSTIQKSSLILNNKQLEYP